MAVVIVNEIEGGSQEMYDEVNPKVMEGDSLPDGCQLHIAGPIENGWRVITVWQIGGSLPAVSGRETASGPSGSGRGGQDFAADQRTAGAQSADFVGSLPQRRGPGRTGRPSGLNRSLHEKRRLRRCQGDRDRGP